MSLTFWIILYLADLLFWLWVVKWGGAEILDETIFAPRWNVAGIKLFANLNIIITTPLFILGIFFPDFRFKI